MGEARPKIHLTQFQ